MVNFIKRVFAKLRINFQRVAFEGLGLSIILFFISLLLFTNILKVVQNGQYNYNVYLMERDSLERIKERNDYLKASYEISSTDESLKLLARDVLGLASPEEHLFRTKQQTEFYDIQKKYIEVDQKTDFTDWWFKLIK